MVTFVTIMVCKSQRLLGDVKKRGAERPHTREFNHRCQAIDSGTLTKHVRKVQSVCDLIQCSSHCDWWRVISVATAVERRESHSEPSNHFN